MGLYARYPGLGYGYALDQRLCSTSARPVCTAGSTLDSPRATARTKSVSWAAAVARMLVVIPGPFRASPPAGSATNVLVAQSLGFTNTGLALMPSRLGACR